MIKSSEKSTVDSKKWNTPYTPLDFFQVEQRAKCLADIIETRLEDLTNILLKYESYEVIQDEITRTLDLLRHLRENKEYFKLRIGAITAFLPRNQPLYAFSCFVVVPSLMASEVYFRIPTSMKGFFSKMLELLEISKYFKNIIVSRHGRLDFLKERSALLINPKTKDSVAVTDAVIFTGTSVHANQLRLVFDKQTLFIANGSGHNPIVISNDANLTKAVEAVLALQFYNQGQDCAAPNAVLVHKDIIYNFLEILHQKVKYTKVGDYQDRLCRIGPISDPKDLIRIQDFLVEHREWLDPSTPGIIRTRDAIVEPTIICKPLSLGGNFREIFAPIIFVQEYKKDADLEYYFEDSRYAHNAMYVTLYGTSLYIKNLIDRPIKEKVLHRNPSFLHNTHLHVRGVERGTEQYGGYGYGASSLSIDGKITPMPTLPQRDIYKKIALRKKTAKIDIKKLKQFTEIQYKNVQKLLRLQSSKSYIEKADYKDSKFEDAYLDLYSIKKDNIRYVKIEENSVCHLLAEPNIKYISALTPEDIRMIHMLKKLLLHKHAISADEFTSSLYSIPKKIDRTQTKSTTLQQHFFGHIYQLLLGQKSGQRLVPFLLDIESEILNKLLDV